MIKSLPAMRLGAWAQTATFFACDRGRSLVSVAQILISEDYSEADCLAVRCQVVRISFQTEVSLRLWAYSPGSCERRTTHTAVEHDILQLAICQARIQTSGLVSSFGKSLALFSKCQSIVRLSALEFGL